MTRGNGNLPAQPPPDLEEPVGTVDLPESDVEEVDEEDGERDDVQVRAAEVHTDSSHAKSKSEPKPPATKPVYVPDLPDLEFTIVRNLFRGSRHWCVKGGRILCQPDEYNGAMASSCPWNPGATTDAFLKEQILINFSIGTASATNLPAAPTRSNSSGTASRNSSRTPGTDTTPG